MKRIVPVIALSALLGCPEKPPAPPPAPQAWYSGGTLRNATPTRWREATDHNRLASSFDIITDRLIASGVNPRQLVPGDLKSRAEQLRDCLSEAMNGAAPEARVPELAPACLEKIDLSWPLRKG